MNKTLSAELYKESGLPEGYFRKTRADYIGEDKPLLQLNKYLENFSHALRLGTGIVLYGVPNSQKSLLMALAVKSLLSQGITARYFTGNSLPDVVMSKNDLTFRIAFKEPQLLALDDLDGSLTSFAKTTLLQVLKLRVDDGNPFILATRVYPENWNTVLGDGVLDILEHHAISVECMVSQHKLLNHRRKLREALEI